MLTTCALFIVGVLCIVSIAAQPGIPPECKDRVEVTCKTASDCMLSARGSIHFDIAVKDIDSADIVLIKKDSAIVLGIRLYSRQAVVIGKDEIVKVHFADGSSVLFFTPLSTVNGLVSIVFDKWDVTLKSKLLQLQTKDIGYITVATLQQGSQRLTFSEQQAKWFKQSMTCLTLSSEF